MIVILLWPDGRVMHGGLDYATLQEALEILQPADYVLCEVMDNSTAKEAKE